jgi:hypothetical protein
MNDKDNRDACDLALMINCGGVVGVAAVQKCAKNNERSECAAIPSYCINNYTKAFGSRKKIRWTGDVFSPLRQRFKLSTKSKKRKNIRNKLLWQGFSIIYVQSY